MLVIVSLVLTASNKGDGEVVTRILDALWLCFGCKDFLVVVGFLGFLDFTIADRGRLLGVEIGPPDCDDVVL